MDTQKAILLLKKKAGMRQVKIAAAIPCHPSNISSHARGIYGSVNPSSKLVDGLRKLLAEHGLAEPQ